MRKLSREEMAATLSRAARIYLKGKLRQREEDLEIIGRVLANCPALNGWEVFQRDALDFGDMQKDVGKPA